MRSTHTGRLTWLAKSRARSCIASLCALAALCGCTNAPAAPHRTATCCRDLLSPPSPQARPPVVLREILTSSPAGPVRGWLARIDLTSPQIQVVVTPPLEDAIDGKREALLQSTDVFARNLFAAQPTPPLQLIAINANFFSNEGGSKNYKPGVPSDIIGLSISAGGVVSPPRTFAALGDPALLIWDKRAEIDRITPQLLARRMAVEPIVAAVAGVGASESDKATGSAMLSGGEITARDARVYATQRHPRTAAGTADNGRTLVLIAIDGRQPGWSVGMTLPELAELLQAEGCTDALNLDGGGSTAIVMLDGAGALTTNRVSDKRFRPVANNLAVIVRGSQSP